MKRFRFSALFFAVASAFLLGAAFGSAKKRQPAVSPNDPTYQLYQLLDSSHGGKLSNLYLLADVYPDPTNPQNMLQHVLRVEYDKSRYFGRFQIDVRSVAKLTEDQLKTYTAKQVYQFGEEDEEKFEKMLPGPFGQRGDLFLRVSADGPLAPTPVTEEVQKEYDLFLTRYILPALKR